MAALAVVAAVCALSSASGAATDVSPGVFNEVATGVAYITTYGCGGRPIGQGTGFLVGDSVVMTARHVVSGACRIRVLVNHERFKGLRPVAWSGSGASSSAADIATMKIDHTAGGAYVFRVRTSLPAPGTNVGMVGYPLGNRLSLNQGKIIARGKRKGAPLARGTDARRGRRERCALHR